MKRPITLDIAAWLVSHAIGFAVRPLFPTHVTPGGFVISSIVVGIIAGTTWVLLRAIVREWLPVRARLIVTVPIALSPFVVCLLLQNVVETSRFILLFPVVIAGLGWGTISELRSRQQIGAP